MQQRSPEADDVQRLGPQLQKALRQMETMMISGVSHGYFRCTVTIQVGKGNRREVIIEAGLSHKFTIPMDELPS